MAEYIKRETLLEHAEYDNNYRLIIPAEAVKAAPAADVAPVVHGRWIHYPDCGVTRCSHCGWSIEECWESKRCPNCGAIMDGGADGEFKDE